MLGQGLSSLNGPRSRLTAAPHDVGLTGHFNSWHRMLLEHEELPNRIGVGDDHQDGQYGIPMPETAIVCYQKALATQRFARSNRQNSDVSVISESPAKAKLSSDRLAASS
jgi:hypothetical protein